MALGKPKKTRPPYRCTLRHSTISPHFSHSLPAKRSWTGGWSRARTSNCSRVASSRLKRPSTAWVNVLTPTICLCAQAVQDKQKRGKKASKATSDRPAASHRHASSHDCISSADELGGTQAAMATARSSSVSKSANLVSCAWEKFHPLATARRARRLICRVTRPGTQGA